MSKDIKLKLELAREELKNKNITIMVKSGDWKDSLDNLIKQESWKRSL